MASSSSRHLKTSAGWQAQRRETALKLQAAQRQRLLDQRRQEASAQQVSFTVYGSVTGLCASQTHTAVQSVIALLLDRNLTQSSYQTLRML